MLPDHRFTQTLARLDLLIVVHVAGWAIYGLGDYFGHIVNGYPDFIPSLFSALGGALLTAAIGWMDHNLRLRSVLLRGAVMVASLYLAAIVWDKTLVGLHVEGMEQTGLDAIGALAPSRWFLPAETAQWPLAVWGIFFVLARVFLTQRDRQRALERAVSDARWAQLQTLRFQLNPHFLFNSLNSLDVSILKGDTDTAHTITQHLSGFLRRTLEGRDADVIPLGEEIAMLRDYVAIEGIRFQDRLTIAVELTEPARTLSIPPMLLQPLVENAIRHAWATGTQARVDVRAWCEGDRLRVSVENDRDRQAPAGRGVGLGLSNTRDRLRLTYNAAASLDVRETDDHYRIDLDLPARTAPTATGGRNA